MSLLEVLTEPFSNEGLFLQLLVRLAIVLVSAVALDLAMGYTGLFQLGHIGFFSLGAVGTLIGVHPDFLAMDLFAGILLGWAFTTVAMVVVGLPTLRLTGDYFAIATLGLGTVAQVVLVGFWANGVPDVPSLNPLGCDLACMADTQVGAGLAAAAAWVLRLDSVPAREVRALEVLILWTISVAVYVAVGRIKRSPFGRVLKSIREDRHAAAALGKNVLAVRFKALWLSACLASLAGSLWVHHVRVMSPVGYGFNTLVFVLLVIILGGLGSHAGALIGVVAVTLLDEYALGLTQWLAEQTGNSDLDFPALRIALFGALLVAMMIWRPSGILGDDDRPLRVRWRTWREGRAAARRDAEEADA